MASTEVVVTTPNGNKVRVGAWVQVHVNGSMVSDAVFPNGELKGTIFIPPDTNGMIVLNVVFSLHPAVSHTATVTWFFNKHGAIIEFPRVAVSPYDEIDSALDYTCKLTPSSDRTTGSVSLLFSPKWDKSTLEKINPYSHATTESMDFSITLTDAPAVSIADTMIYGEREVTFGPFVTGKTYLEKGDLDDEVETWFNTLTPRTQQAIKDANHPADMPGGEPLRIMGYTSTLGNKKYNKLLGWDRSKAVLTVLHRVTGNENVSIYRTPGIGEGPRETDIRSEEDNHPEWRKVVVSLYVPI